MTVSAPIAIAPSIRFFESDASNNSSETLDIGVMLIVALAGCIGAAMSFVGLALVVLMLLNGTGLLASLSLVAGLMFTVALILCAGLYHHSQTKNLLCN